MEPTASCYILLSLCSLCLYFFFRHVLLRANSNNRSKILPFPPSASPLPFIIHIFFRRRSIYDIVHILRRFHSLLGPIFSLRLTPFSKPSIFISDPHLAHSALIVHGAAFADRPHADSEPARFLTVNNHDISSSFYGSLWQLLRRNLTSETLHSSRIRLFAPGRRWALEHLLNSLRSQSGLAVVVKETFQQAIFSLVVLLCFGEKLSMSEIRDIESPLVFLLSTFTSFNVFAVFPAVTKVLFRKRWENIVRCREREAEIFLPMIRARRERIQSAGTEYCYVDSLLDLKLPKEGGRGLTDDELVVLCHEFLAGGIDTTTTALEWTMAELVKNQCVQSKIWMEIQSLMESDDVEIIEEEDLQRMPYLKALLMESLRRHPPGHFVLPHSVTEDVTLGGFLIPKGTEVNFAVADVNWDRRNWADPFEFRPERFMAGGDGEGLDLSGRREIKIMTFGAGRRMCPGYRLAMLHLEFFVANLVKEFEWKVESGSEVDLSEKLEFTMVMKHPLRARLFPRFKK
ncbi:hypothetical protein KFK09_023907 [Dendrobium nobile]|uniref:Cytochrome P450 n=1 Tax=Dendrobium nobile TaxID=94219 RepID=A0A8T3ADC2_DENNO|nr:hypothetical protein KFK09_023907 [Dendrobium nobile]